MGLPRIDGTPTKTQKAMRTLNEDQPLSVRSSRRPVSAPTSRLSEDPILEDKEMKTTLLHVRRLAVAAALLGAIVSPRAVSAQSALDASEAGAFMGSWSVSVQSDFGPLEFPLMVTDQDGKVAVMVGLPDPTGAGAGDPVPVTNVTRSGEGLVLNYDLDAQGQLVPVSLTLTPNGEDLAAVFDIGGGAFSASGTARRASD